MPNCSSLARKSEPTKPVALTVIDEEMCKHFNVKCDPKVYYAYWYDHIGFGLAMGRDFASIRKYWKGLLSQADPLNNGIEERMIEIVDWLDSNFVSDAWSER